MESLHLPEIVQNRDYGGFNFGDTEDLEGTKGTKGGMEELKEAIKINLDELDTSRNE